MLALWLTTGFLAAAEAAPEQPVEIDTHDGATPAEIRYWRRKWEEQYKTKDEELAEEAIEEIEEAEADVEVPPALVPKPYVPQPIAASEIDVSFVGELVRGHVEAGVVSLAQQEREEARLAAEREVLAEIARIEKRRAMDEEAAVLLMMV